MKYTTALYQKLTISQKNNNEWYKSGKTPPAFGCNKQRRWAFLFKNPF